jgi:hypothetical protein
MNPTEPETAGGIYKILNIPHLGVQKCRGIVKDPFHLERVFYLSPSVVPGTILKTRDRSESKDGPVH